MKHYCIISLLLLVQVLVNGQKALPRALQPYAQQIPAAAAKVLQKAGYAIEDQPLASLSRSNALRLDSTKTFYGYGNPTPADSTPLFRTTYDYPQPDQRVETNYQFDATAWTTINRITQRIDALDRVVEENGEMFNPATQTFLPDSRMRVYPRNNSATLFDSLFVWRWEPSLNDWSLIFEIKQVFDAQDRLLEVYSFLDVLGQPLAFKEVYEYDANGDNTLIQNYALFDGQEFLASMIETSYENHLPVEVIAYAVDPGGLVAQSRVTYSYNAFQKEDVVKSFEWSLDLNDWFQTQEDIFTYDNEARVILEERRFYNQDGGEDREQIAYRYIAGDQLSMTESFIWDGGGFYFMIDRTYYYYQGLSNTGGPQPTGQPLALFPNPTKGLLQLDLQQPAYIQIFNTNGVQVSTGRFYPGDILHVSDLPSGLYYINARTEQAVFTGKIAKE